MKISSISGASVDKLQGVIVTKSVQIFLCLVHSVEQQPTLQYCDEDTTFLYDFSSLRFLCDSSCP